MGLADAVEQAVGERRAPKPDPRAILARELENERTLLLSAAPEKRALHENNIRVINSELSGKPIAGAPGSGGGVDRIPVMGSNVVPFAPQKGGLADTVESALTAPSGANVSHETSRAPITLSSNPREALSGLPDASGFNKKQIQPSDVGDAMLRSVRGVGASILGGVEGLRQLANGYGSESAANAVQATVERGTGRPETPGGMLLQDVMHSPFNPLTWPSRIGAAAGNAVLKETGSPAAATTADTAINALPAILLRGNTGKVNVPRVAANETVRETVSRPQTASIPLSSVGSAIDITAQNPVSRVSLQPVGATDSAPAVTVAGNASAVANPVEAAAKAKGVTWEQQAAIDTIRRFAKDPDAILRAENTQLVPGSKPTLAEVTKDPGLAQLQRSQQSKNTALANDISDNRAARTGARNSLMEQFAGSPEELAYFTDARRQITKPLYEAAFSDKPRFTPQVLEQINTLMEKPAIKDAMTEAARLAKNEGADTSNALRSMHYMKMAIDDKISAAVKAGSNNEVRILHGVQDELVGLMQKVSPSYARAMAEFHAASKPINRLEVGQYLKEKLLPAVNGYGGDRTTIGQFVKALEHPDQSAKLATKFSGAKMSDILTKDEISTLRSLAEDVVRQQNVESAARITGSQTAQLQAAQGKLASSIENLVDRISASPVPIVSHAGAITAWGHRLVKERRAAKYEGELNRMLMEPDYAKSVYQKAKGTQP